MLPVIPLAPPPAIAPGGVPTALRAKMGRGVNIVRWFCYQPNYDDPARMRSYVGAKDIAVLKRLGVTFIRLAVSPEAAYTSLEKRDGEPSPTRTAFVDNAVNKLGEAGMAVSLDLHDNGQLKLDEAGRDPKDLIAFWRATARRWRGKAYDRLLFEIVNEPVFQKNPEAWDAMQRRAVQAIRDEDPKRTIVVSANQWSGRDALLASRPLPYRNLVYTFHFYDPMEFTHQGAEWTDEYLRDLKGVPFPSSPENIEPIAATSKAPYDAWLRNFAAKNYNAALIESKLVEAAEWGRRNGVPVFVGEFGAYPKAALPADRERWFQAVRGGLDASGLPFAIWGYDDALGLERQVASDGTINLDPMVERVVFGQGAGQTRSLRSIRR